MKIIGDPNVSMVALHHTAVRRTQSQLYAVNNYHQDKWGMKSSLGWYVGYNFFCDYDGTITQTRAVGEETIANVGHNCDVESRCDTISFCFVGDYNNELPNDKQIAAFKKWLKELRGYYPGIDVVGHRDIQPNRTCPGVLMTDDYIRTRLLGSPHYSDWEDAEKQREIEFLLQQVSLLQKLIVLLKKLKSLR